MPRSSSFTSLSTSCSLSVVLSLLGIACDGSLGGADEGDDEARAQEERDALIENGIPGLQLPECDPDASSPGLPLRRLSQVQARNTLNDLVERVSPTHSAAIQSELAEALGQYPADLAEGPDGHIAAFTRIDQTVHQEHIDAVYEIGVTLGAALTQSERLGEIVGDCATDANSDNDEACLSDFISRFGRLVQRRNLEQEDLEFYRESVGEPPLVAADYADIVGLLINSPYAFYLVEHGQETDEELAPLSPFELASRLSYHFWQTAPDEELLQAAEDGSLLTEEGYEAQLNRVYTDSRTANSLEEFYRQWLHQSHIEPLNSRANLPAFESFADGFEPSGETHHHMEQELAEMGRYYSLDTEATFDDFFSSRRSFATTEDVAAIYGVPVWERGTDPPSFPDPERVGLISRAALLSNASGQTRPVMKGLFIRKGLLCTDVPPPPPDVMAGEPDSESGSTTREVLEGLTEQPGTACANCHSTAINPLGYVTEGFDALGRVRQEQSFFDQMSGELLGQEPVNTVTTPQVIYGDETEVSSPEEVVDLILESGFAHACFSRVYFRYTFGRSEDMDRDGCAISEMSELLRGGATLGEALRSIALSDAFKTHNFEEAMSQ